MISYILKQLLRIRLMRLQLENWNKLLFCSCLRQDTKMWVKKQTNWVQFSEKSELISGSDLSSVVDITPPTCGEGNTLMGSVKDFVVAGCHSKPFHVHERSNSLKIELVHTTGTIHSPLHRQDRDCSPQVESLTYVLNLLNKPAAR